MTQTPRKTSSLYITAPLRPTFERERDPLHAKGLNDLNKTEAQRRRESVQYDAAKAKRRESYMVKRQRPNPQHRPGPQLSMGADRAAFNAEWRLEQRLAHEDQQREQALKQGYQAKAQLEQAQATTQQALKQTHEAKAAMSPAEAKANRREVYKTFRRAQQQGARGHDLADRFLSVAPKR